MDNNSSLQAIRDLLQRNDPIGIIVGQNPNLDEMAGALSLFLSLKQMNKNVVVACPTDPLVEISSLVGIDKVKKSLGGGTSGDLIVSFPYKEGEIEKVSYTLEEGYLNIVVKAGGEGLTFSENEVKFERGGNGAPKILFIVGTSRLSDLGNLFDPQNLKDTTVVNIDNKRENQGFGDIVFVDSNFSSVSEQIYDLLTYLGFDPDSDIAQNLLLGISFGTENFQSPKTSATAFEVAGRLMKKGAIRQKVEPVSPKQPFWEDDLGLPPVPGFQTQPSQKTQRPNWQQNFPRQNQKPFRQQPQQQGGQQQQQRKPYQGYQSQQGQRFPQNPKPSQSTQPVQNNNAQNSVNDDEDAPADWLTPKIYKGSGSLV